METDGSFLLMKLPMREMLSELTRLGKLALGCFSKEEAEGVLLLTEVLLSKILVELMFLLWDIVGDSTADGVGDCRLPIRRPISEVPPVSMRLPMLVVGCLTTVGAEGAFAVIELPMRKVLPELMLLPKLEVDRFAMGERTLIDVLLLEGRRALKEVCSRRVGARLSATPLGPWLGSTLLD